MITKVGAADGRGDRGEREANGTAGGARSPAGRRGVCVVVSLVLGWPVRRGCAVVAALRPVRLAGRAPKWPSEPRVSSPELLTPPVPPDGRKAPEQQGPQPGRDPRIGAKHRVAAEDVVRQRGGPLLPARHGVERPLHPLLERRHEAGARPRILRGGERSREAQVLVGGQHPSRHLQRTGFGGHARAGHLERGVQVLILPQRQLPLASKGLWSGSPEPAVSLILPHRGRFDDRAPTNRRPIVTIGVPTRRPEGRMAGVIGSTREVPVWAYGHRPIFGRVPTACAGCSPNASARSAQSPAALLGRPGVIWPGSHGVLGDPPCTPPHPDLIRRRHGSAAPGRRAA